MTEAWSTPPFDSLDDAGDGFRWVGTTIMGEAQYRAEGWECRIVNAYERRDDDHLRRRRVTYWRARMSGLVAWGDRAAMQRAEARELRQYREEEDKAMYRALDYPDEY